MLLSRRHAAIPCLSALVLMLAACGGGGSESTNVSPEDAARVAAANQTATSHPECAISRLGAPFYWEIGDANGVRANGQVGSGAPDASTLMSIASASKWVYAAYAVQRLGLRSQDVPYLNFTSGYTEMVLPLCAVGDTVASCVQGKDGLVASTQNRFFYGSGHMQVHASTVLGIGAMDNGDLTADFARVLGDHGFTFTQPQMAGGLVANAAGYASFLRRLLRGELTLGSALGANKVCTNCASAIAAPVPATEFWNYSLGHWVEDDPNVGDGAFSSAGVLGFYPWISADRTLYGVVARRDDLEDNSGYESARCGRLIRRAFQTGVAAGS
jgi:hypothetical protein